MYFAEPPMPSPVIEFITRARRRLFRLRHMTVLLFLMSCIIAAAHETSAQAERATVSVAETLLFETDHLAHLKPPVVLVYEFRKVSNVEPGFVDKVELDLKNSNGKTDAVLHFLTGPRNHAIPPLRDVHGNPVLLGFLERDVAEMKRLTGGSAEYFRKRIRMVLATDTRVRAQTIVYDGKKVQAQSVRIQPYLNDPMHARFEPYIHKTYVFIMSDQVPGGVYQLSTSLGTGVTTAAAIAPPVGSAGAGTHPAGPGNTVTPLPAADETLTLVSVRDSRR